MAPAQVKSGLTFEDAQALVGQLVGIDGGFSREHGGVYRVRVGATRIRRPFPFVTYCLIVSFRHRWHDYDFLCMPLLGHGSRWVRYHKLQHITAKDIGVIPGAWATHLRDRVAALVVPAMRRHAGAGTWKPRPS